MRCSVSPFSRANTVCMLRQLAQPLICEARISTRWTSFGSRLAAIAIDVPCHFFMSSGEAAKGLSFGVMVRLRVFATHIQTNEECGNVTSAPKKFAKIFAGAGGESFQRLS